MRLSKTVEDFLGPVDPAAMLEELDQKTTDHERRVLIGERLAVLGDPRPGLGLRDGGIPDIAWCDVPPGEITLELERRRLWGKTRKHKQVERFRISQYLVTYAQYRAFVEAKDGYRDERWWGDLDHDREPGRQFMRFDNHPADNVSWFDALAFCRWLTYKYRACGWLAEDRTIGLPTEWAWQQAAAGGDPARGYPWGRGWDIEQEPWRANTYESKLGCATAVGLYPGGSSPVGVLDMAGNLWEWCRNKYHAPHVIASRPDDFDERVLRGGSWDYHARHARSANRGRDHPGARHFHMGFRPGLFNAKGLDKPELYRG